MRVTTIAGCLVLGLTVLATAPAPGYQRPPPNLAQLTPEIPTIRRLAVSYEGNEGLRQDFRLGLVQPTAMASADFDADGVQDLVCGHVGVENSAVALHRGNIDSIFPHSPAARQRKAEGAFTDAPFLSPALLFTVPGRPDFLAAGDFCPNRGWRLDEALSAGPERAAAVYGDLLTELSRKDLSAVNVELPLSDAGEPIVKCGPNLHGPPEAVDGVTAGLFDVALLANNHMLDFGASVLLETMELLRSHGLEVVGAGDLGPRGPPTGNQYFVG